MILNLIILYLIGVILAENQLIKKEHRYPKPERYKWFSWATFFILLIRET